MFDDLPRTAVADDGAAPVEPTAALVDDRATPGRVSAAAAHHLAPVGAVVGPVAAAALRARRTRALVGVAEVRRRLHVDQLRRTRTSAGRLPPEQSEAAGRALETSARATFAYQRHLPTIVPNTHAPSMQSTSGASLYNHVVDVEKGWNLLAMPPALPQSSV